MRYNNVHIPMIIIVYGSILPAFPNNRAAIVSEMERTTPHPPPTPFHAQCQLSKQRNFKMGVKLSKIIEQHYFPFFCLKKY
jgi:hypothetical protein